MTSSDTHIRLATLADLEQIIAMRMQLFRYFSDLPNVAEDASLREATTGYYRHMLQHGPDRTWVAERGEELVGMVTLTEFVRAPYPGNLQGREAYVLNMYVDPECRRHGLSRRMFDQLMHYAREQVFGRIWLHASEMARELYLEAGFAPNPKALEIKFV